MTSQAKSPRGETAAEYSEETALARAAQAMEPPLDLMAIQENAPRWALPFAEKMEKMMRGMVSLQTAILSQQAEIAKLNRALDAVRVTRSQELAIGEAIRSRAKQIAREENLPGKEKKIAGAIRATLREVTGARAAGDIQASQFARSIDLIGSWRMAGAIRKIRKEAQAHDE